MSLNIGSYGLASGLVGFPTSELRVKVTEAARSGHIWVMTADLADAGTPLVLREEQVQPLEDYVSADAWQHKSGLVIFA